MLFACSVMVRLKSDWLLGQTNLEDFGSVVVQRTQNGCDGGSLPDHTSVVQIPRKLTGSWPKVLAYTIENRRSTKGKIHNYINRCCLSAFSVNPSIR